MEQEENDEAASIENLRVQQQVARHLGIFITTDLFFLILTSSWFCTTINFILCKFILLNSSDLFYSILFYSVVLLSTLFYSILFFSFLYPSSVCYRGPRWPPLLAYLLRVSTIHLVLLNTIHWIVRSPLLMYAFKPPGYYLQLISIETLCYNQKFAISRNLSSMFRSLNISLKFYFSFF